MSRATFSRPNTKTPCKVTGNLAVTTSSNTVYVYQNAQGSPTKYLPYNLSAANDAAYDGAGNLFVNGTYTNHHFALIELPYGSITFQNISFVSYGNIDASEPILWDGQYLDMGSETSVGRPVKSLLKRLQISGSSATLIDTIPLGQRSRASLPQFWIQDSALIQPKNRLVSSVSRYRYPGGKRIGQVTLGGWYDIWGAVVSVAPSRSHVRN